MTLSTRPTQSIVVRQWHRRQDLLKAWLSDDKTHKTWLENTTLTPMHTPTQEQFITFLLVFAPNNTSFLFVRQGILAGHT